MKKFYCCDYCDELFETEAECKAHEATCTEKKDYDESRKMDKDSLILHLREFIEEVEIFNEAYGADIMDELLDDFRDGKLSFDGCDCEHKCDDTCDCDCDCDCIALLLLYVFLGPHPQHMEAPRLGVESELQLLAYTTAHSNTGSLTH